MITSIFSLFAHATIVLLIIVKLSDNFIMIILNSKGHII